MSLSQLLRPRSIAVVGATPRHFIGRISLENSAALGYRGVVTPVNARHEAVAGIATVGSIEDLPEVPDLVMVQVATDRVLDGVRAAVRAGARRFVVPGGGFTDSGMAATVLHEGLADLAAEHGVAVVGPNCMGVVDLVTGAAPYVGTVPSAVRRGRVGVLAQSGAVVEAVVNAGGRVPLSTAVSCGSEATTSMADYLEFFTEDGETDAVLAFVEALVDPELFLVAARRFTAAGKTLAACVVGRSAVARRGVAAHSGRLAPSARVTAAALRQAGVVLVEDLDELLAVGELLGAGAVPRGPRLHLVTNSGGEGNLLADLADDAGLELPALGPDAVGGLQGRWPRFQPGNPLDPWGVDDHLEVYPAALAAAAAEPGDILAIGHDQERTAGRYERDLGCFLARTLAEVEAPPAKARVLISPTSQDPDADLERYCRDHGVALLRGARPALRALGALAAAGGPDTPVRAVPAPHPALRQDDPLTEDEALTVLGDLGVPVPEQRRARTPDEAVAAAGELGGPVAVKAVAPGLWHKTDLDLVRLGLRTPEEVRRAAEEVLESGAEHRVELLVVRMARGVLDVLVGYTRDPRFGPTLLVGLGGVWTEMLDRVAIHVGELDLEAARRFVDTSPVGRMLGQWRGGALDTTGVARALAAISALTAAHPEIVTVDLNPLMVGPGGAVAVDAVIQRTQDLKEDQ